jgi:hypothetical protein
VVSAAHRWVPAAAATGAHVPRRQHLHQMALQQAEAEAQLEYGSGVKARRAGAVLRRACLSVKEPSQTLLAALRGAMAGDETEHETAVSKPRKELQRLPHNNRSRHRRFHLVEPPAPGRQSCWEQPQPWPNQHLQQHPRVNAQALRRASLQILLANSAAPCEAASEVPIALA